MALVKPHGKKKKLMPLLLEGSALRKELKKAKTLKQLKISSRETADLVMMGIGAFTPLTGFMGKKDWKGVCSDKFKLADGTFWPVPVTLSCSKEFADSLKKNEEICLVDEEAGTIMATMKVAEKYEMTKADKEHECKMIFRTNDVAGHPGVQKVMGQPDMNLGGPVKVLSEAHFPETFKGIYMKPVETRKIFEDKGWSTVAAFQTRNPMHRSHEYLAKIAIETMDGVLVHQILGKLKEGDIPADVRAEAINTLMDKYFVKDSAHPVRLSHGNALCRAARSAAPRAFPPELRLQPSDRRPRPCRRGRLLRPVRCAEDLRRYPEGRARDQAPQDRPYVLLQSSATAWPP